MSDLKRYIARRSKRQPSFTAKFESGYQSFELGVILRQARERAGVTQGEIARKLRTKKSDISRIENHAEDIRLSTLWQYADALGLRLNVQLTD